VSGFRAVALVAALLLAVGFAQLCALAVREEPYPIAAAALALLLVSGGAVIAAFIARNRGASRSASPADFVTGSALAVIGGLAIWVFAGTGVFFPLRMALFFRRADVQEAPLPMMLAGSCLLALGAAATAALTGALWLWLYARGPRRASQAAGAALSFAGAVPYVAFALVVRALVCKPVAFLAAGRFLALRPDEQLAYRSMLGAAPGLLAASLALGLAVGRGLWSWLEQVRVAEEESDSFLTARLRGQEPWQIVLRQGLWLRRRRELGALLLGGMAASALIDILSSTLIDSFRPPGFPAYPSLGAALFLRGIGTDGAPLPLDFGWRGAHAIAVFAALLLMLAQTLPQKARRISLRDGVLRVGPGALLRGVGSAHGLPPRPSVQWVLGESGAGKSALLHAWAAQLENAVLVPQDPDDALPAALSATDLSRLARDGQARGDRVLFDLLGRLDDHRIRRRLQDPFTSVASFSRGERQRLLLCLALSRSRGEPGSTLLLDEPTSAQDGPRAGALLECLREHLISEGAGSMVLTSHDPEPVDALLGDREPVPDHVLWLEDGASSSFSIGEGRRWKGRTQAPPALQRYLESVSELLQARAAPDSFVESSRDAVRLLPSRLEIGGRPFAVSREAVVRPGELVVLSGPSGCGKTTLLRALAAASGSQVAVGYLAQDTARAFPPEMPVREVLAARDPERLARWFAGEPPPERPIGALSEGERQRVVWAGEAIRLSQAKAKLQLLLLDEPFGAQDPPAHLRLMESLLSWLREERGRASVLVTHSPAVDLGLSRLAGVPAVEWAFEGGAR
jgi:ABC-type nitrate/sulfonate/bicarbonate transport system ATPase subunit